jgi:energy-coupling factor transport system permease protein
MEARGFGAGPRTWARESRVGVADLCCLLGGFAAVGLSLGVALAVGTFRWIGAV